LLNTFKGIAQVKLGTGDTILFWSDMWNGRIMKISFAQLYSFALKENIIVKEVIEQDNLQDIFHLPLFEETYEQCCELDALLQSLQFSGENDTWSYIWGNGQYSSVKAYKHLLGSRSVHPTFN
jgi:hypothetical protein